MPVAKQKESIDTFLTNVFCNFLKHGEKATKMYGTLGVTLSNVFDFSRHEYESHDKGIAFDPITKGKRKLSGEAFNACLEACLLDSAIPTIIQWSDCKDAMQTFLNVSAFWASKIPPGATQVKALNRVCDITEAITGIKIPSRDKMLRVEGNLDKAFDSVFGTVTGMMGMMLDLPLEKPQLAKVDPLSAKQKQQQAKTSDKTPVDKDNSDAKSLDKPPADPNFLQKFFNQISRSNA